MPILEIILHQLKRALVDEVILTVDHLSYLIQAFFQDGERFGLKIHYSSEEHSLGTAGPLSLVDGLDKPFLVVNGDVLSTLDFQSIVDFHRTTKAIATIAAHTRQVKIDLGVIQSNKSNRVTGYIEKPTYEFYVSMGIYVIEPRLLSYIPYNQYLDFPDLFLRLIQAGEKVASYPFDGYWQDLSRPDDYEQAIQEFEKMKPLLFGNE